MRVNHFFNKHRLFLHFNTSAYTLFEISLCIGLLSLLLCIVLKVAHLKLPKEDNDSPEKIYLSSWNKINYAKAVKLHNQYLNVKINRDWSVIYLKEPHTSQWKFRQQSHTAWEDFIPEHTYKNIKDVQLIFDQGRQFLQFNR